MGYVIIDTGTTNTRVKYLKDDRMVAEYREVTGARNVAVNGSDQCLRECIRRGIGECLASTDDSSDDIEAIIASGMITSDHGLHEMPHLEAPVSIGQLASSIESCIFEDITDKPIHFIPGVRNRVEYDILDVDMMRGEETEAFGAKQISGLDGNLIYVSPGSHTKFVFIDGEDRITGCSTTLTGEILKALSKETILAGSIPDELLTGVDREYMIKGIRMVEKHGFSKTCFMTRILDVFSEASDNQRTNFLMAAICYYDMKSIEDDYHRDKKILIGGPEILRDFYYELFEVWGYDMENVFKMDNESVDRTGVVGASLIMNVAICKEELYSNMI